MLPAPTKPRRNHKTSASMARPSLTGAFFEVPIRLHLHVARSCDIKPAPTVVAGAGGQRHYLGDDEADGGSASTFRLANARSSVRPGLQAMAIVRRSPADERDNPTVRRSIGADGGGTATPAITTCRR